MANSAALTPSVCIQSAPQGKKMIGWLVMKLSRPAWSETACGQALLSVVSRGCRNQEHTVALSLSELPGDPTCWGASRISAGGRIVQT